MDTLPPTFEPEPQYSNATFVNGESTTRQNLSFAETSNLPIRIVTDNVSLNGTPILEGPLDQSNIPWIRLRAEDAAINDVFTPKNEITAEIQYSLGGEVLTPWRLLVPVITGNNNYRFLVPLVSEVLHEDWHLATPIEEHFIEVKIKDKAGNEADYTFRVTIEFVAPPLTIEVSKTNNPFDVSFAERASLYNQIFPVAEYTIRNKTNKSILFNLGNSSVHILWNRHEEAQRIHETVKAIREEWRIQYRFALLNPQVPGQQLQWVEINADWKHIGAQDVRMTGGGSRPIHPPAPIELWSGKFNSDELPAPVPGAWASFHPSGADVSNTNYIGPRPNNHYLATVGYHPSMGNYLQRRTVNGFKSRPGHPFNEYKESRSGTGFYDDHLEVLNEIGSPAIPQNGFFRLLPGQRFTILKFVKTPPLERQGFPITFNDTEVGDPTTFSSYTPKRYDKRLDWILNYKLEIVTVHDTGFEKVDEMVAVNYESQLARNFEQYTLSR